MYTSVLQISFDYVEIASDSADYPHKKSASRMHVRKPHNCSSEVPPSSNSIRRSQTAAVCKFPSFFCVPVAIVPDDPAGAEIQGLLFDSRELNPASILVFPAWLPAPIVRIARRQRDVVRCSRLYVGWGTHLSIFRPAGCLPAGVAGPAIGLTLCSRAGLTYPNIIGKDLCSALACARLPSRRPAARRCAEHRFQRVAILGVHEPRSVRGSEF